MNEKQKQQARTLEYFPFETGSEDAKFVDRMSNYAKYVPNTELTNQDAKQLQRLFVIYVRENAR